MSEWIVDWKVEIEGRDISQDLRPYLERISATDKAGFTSDTCSLVLDDSEGVIKLPSAGSRLKVWLQDQKIFEGITDRPKSKGSRGAGQKLTIKAKGFDERDKAKQPLSYHKDDATLGEFLSEAAQKAGYEVTVDPELADIARDYWSANSESFLQLGQRFAREYHGTFKLRGKKAVLKVRGKDLGLPTVEAARGVNIISWDLEPRGLRRAFSGGSGRYLDRDAGKVVEVERPYKSDEIEDPVLNAIRATTADEAQTLEQIKAREGQGAREKGSGTITIDLAPHAMAEALCKVQGAREGIDGTYRIESRTHTASRGKGAETKLTLKEPQDGAGKRK